ncbi:MAG: GAF domain-containing protein [Candidatus Rokuibacteriota bacterium]
MRTLIGAVTTRAAAGADRAALTMMVRGSGLVLALVIVVPFAALIAHLGYAAASRESTRVQQEALILARALGAQVEAHLTARLDSLARAAETVAATRDAAGAVEAQLRLLRRTHPELALILVLDERGTVRLSSGTARSGDQEWRRPAALATEPFVGEPRLMGSSQVVGLSVPVRARGGHPSGWVVAELSLADLPHLLGRVSLGSGTVAEIRTPDGVLIAREPELPRLLGRPSRVRSRTSDLLRQERGTGEVMLEDGVRRRVGAAMIRPSGWIVLVGRPTTAIRIEAGKLFVQVGAGGAIAVLVALTLALPVVSRLAGGLARLRAAMDRLEGGEIPANVPVTIGGELGALTDGFNRALGRLRSQLGDYRALGEVEEAASAALAVGRPLEAVLTDLLRNVMKGMNADVGLIALQEAEGLVTKATVGLWGIPQEEIVLRRGQGVAGAVLRRRDVAVIPDTASDPQTNEPHIGSAGLRSVIAAPMVVHDRAIGLVEVGYRAPHGFAPVEVQRFQALVQRVVQAFQHARALEAEPDLDTRVTILKRRAALDGVSLADDVAFLIATEVPSNIRELEASLTRILAFAGLTGRELTLDVAREFLDHVWRVEREPGSRAGPETRPTPFLAIVQRDATHLFEAFRQHVAKPGVVEVIWDRRVRPRRQVRNVAVRDRRRGDRRRAPPWAGDGRDYVLVRRQEAATA